MKKTIFSLAISAALLGSVATYAANENPGMLVKESFTKEFTKVKDVEWTTISKEGVYQATFIFNNESLQAFFAADGEFLGTTRQVSKSQLPILVVTELDKKYPDARIATIFEYSKKDGLAYYITLVGNKGGVIVRATGDGELVVQKKNL